jgi:hypothetical protein
MGAISVMIFGFTAKKYFYANLSPAGKTVSEHSLFAISTFFDGFVVIY